MKRIALFLLLLSFAIPTNAQQKLHSTVDVNIKYQPIPAELLNDNTIVTYAQVYPYIMMVEQTVALKDYTADTLILNLEYTSMFNQITTQMLFADVIIETKTASQPHYQQIDYSFDGTKLICMPNFGNGQVRVKYKYQSDFFFSKDVHNRTSLFMTPQIYGWHSWYFTNNDMTIDRIEFSVPPQAYFWATDTRTAADNHSVITDPKDVSFYLLDKSYYVEQTLKTKNITVNILSNKGIAYDTVCNDDGQQITILHPKNELVSKPEKPALRIIKKSLDALRSIFSQTEPITINIADAFLSIPMGKDTVRWGNSTKCSNNENFILIDTISWGRSVVIHEIAHCFQKNLPDKSDSTYYFIAESLIEYIATYLLFDQDASRDEAFNKAGMVECDSISIFKLQDNAFGGQINTSDIIYRRTPYKIHCFSKLFTEPKFIELLTKFYASQKPDWTTFKQVMRSGGITDKQWREFVLSL